MKAIISEVLTEARRRLAAAPFRPDTREAILLLGHVLSWSEPRVIARQDRSLNSRQVRLFDTMLDRRLTGEPVAYIVGHKEFYGRRFLVDKRVLIPRPETEHLIEVVLELALPPRASILDLGTGSGCVAATLALEISGSRIVASDISIGALAVARHNLGLHGLTRRVRLLAGDLAGAVSLEGFDLVVSNPPYIDPAQAPALSPEIVDFEPDTALFAELSGEAFHRSLIAELTGLRPESWLILEIGADQGGLIRGLAADSAFNLVQMRPDLADHPRVAVLQRR